MTVLLPSAISRTAEIVEKRETDWDTLSIHAGCNEPFQKCDLKRSMINIMEMEEWLCVLLLLIYSRNVSHDKHVSTLRSDVAVKIFLTCTVTAKDISNGCIASTKSLRDKNG